jgi:molybdopterin-binding protein
VACRALFGSSSQAIVYLLSTFTHPITFWQESYMLSARNQLPVTVKSVKLGGVMAEVVLAFGDYEIVSVITRGSAEQLDLKAGDNVRAVIKSTEVLVDKP